jgi:hypothetical protein
MTNCFPKKYFFNLTLTVQFQEEKYKLGYGPIGYRKLPLKNLRDCLFSDADYFVLKGMFKNINADLHS